MVKAAFGRPSPRILGFPNWPVSQLQPNSGVENGILKCGSRTPRKSEEKETPPKNK